DDREELSGRLLRIRGGAQARTGLHARPLPLRAGRIAGEHQSRARRGGAQAIPRLYAQGERANARQRAYVPRRRLREGRQEGRSEAGLRDGAQAQPDAEIRGGRVEARVLKELGKRKGDRPMKQTVALTVSSMLTILFSMFHLTDDILRGN